MSRARTPHVRVNSLRGSGAGGLDTAATGANLGRVYETSSTVTLLPTMTEVELEPGEEEIEDNLGPDGEEVLPYRYSLTSYGADYPVDGLVKRLREDSIHIPSFQRGFVWSLSQASRFVESLLLGLPVPGIFLSREEESGRLLVIDGQQRLTTLLYFYDGIFRPTGREFALSGVQSHFVGSTYESLDVEDRRRLDDSIMHATIVRQDTPSEDDSSIYHIFERLNRGGTLLSSQEIRAAIYHGEFNDVLADLNNNAEWREMFGPVNKRMRDQELILRFLAFRFEADDYEKPLKGFLNGFMGRNRHLQGHSESDLREAFEAPLEIVYRSVGPRAFRPRRNFNAAVFDSVMVGVARRLADGDVTNLEVLEQNYGALVRDEDFMAATELRTADEDSVETRLRLATAAFADVP
jgi:hypothetical protein